MPESTVFLVVLRTHAAMQKVLAFNSELIKKLSGIAKLKNEKETCVEGSWIH